ncbi:hypothetical protein LTR66_006610 [Elasticomyces elasticus]|nr:hypothetical protein LTR66_006610 [Elasticomyces elasticus]
MPSSPSQLRTVEACASEDFSSDCDIPSIIEHTQKCLVLELENDTIRECGAAALAIIASKPDDVLRLAHRKLHTWPFRDVPICWRRLYEDASLWKAIALLRVQTCRRNPKGHAIDTVSRKRKRRGEQENPKGHSSSPAVERPSTTDDGINLPTIMAGDWVADIVKVLDMAIILTGAPSRKHLFNNLFNNLQSSLLHEVSKLDTLRGFPPSHLRRPKVRFPMQNYKALGSDMNFTALQEHLDASASPLILEGAISHWPACSAWKNPAHLMQHTLGGRRLVPVELGRSYTDEDWGQKIMTFAEFVHDYLINPMPKQTGYLAQHDLLTQIPGLLEDIQTPDYCFTTPPPATPELLHGQPTPPHLEEPLVNTWLGPGGTISPLHTDPYHNILCQVVGHKYIRLYAPSETPKLYSRGVDEAGVSMENTSRVDVSIAMELAGRSAAVGCDDEISHENARNDFEERFPLFKDARYIEAVLGPGDSLYIPLGWWHYVESLSTSCSVSFWWN